MSSEPYRTNIARRRGACLAVAFAALMVGVVATGEAQMPADSVLRDFQPSGDYLLVLDGEEVPKAEVYRSQRAAAFLVLSSKIPTPVLISPRTGGVESVHLMKVAKRKDGSIDLLADATLSRLGSFTLDGEEVVFKIEGKEARLRPRPPLVGEQELEGLLAHSPEYRQGATAYNPDPQALGALRGQSRPVTVRVFFGSWCDHCKQHLPHLIKVEEELDGSEIDFDYYGLPRPPQAWDDAEVKRLKVKGVPTAIVYIGGKEAGRLFGNDWLRPESALSRIINGGTKSSGAP